MWPPIGPGCSSARAIGRLAPPSSARELSRVSSRARDREFFVIPGHAPARTMVRNYAPENVEIPGSMLCIALESQVLLAPICDKVNRDKNQQRWPLTAAWIALWFSSKAA